MPVMKIMGVVVSEDTPVIVGENKRVDICDAVLLGITIPFIFNHKSR